MRSLDRDLTAIFFLCAAAAVPILWPALRGLTPFWGDLTYIHFPWRTVGIENIQAGRLPLWDPYLYFGMPASAAMQDSIFYPGTVTFLFFGFSGALVVFHLLHYGLSAALAFLWLRSCALKRSASIAGAAVVCLGGVWLENRPFLNHLGALTMMPALFLFARRPKLLAPALCASFLTGYPQITAGSAAAAFAAGLLLCRERRELIRGWLSAGAWSLAMSGLLLLPAAELVGLSHRSSGVGLEEALQFGFAPADLAQWISPLLVKDFNPAVEWWKTCFVGFSGLVAAVLGIFALRGRRAPWIGAWLVFVLLLTLGGTNPASRAFWDHLPFLRFVRYPGNFSYMAVPALALLAAAGLQMKPKSWAGLAALLVVCELCAYDAGAFPLAGASLFSTAGPLVRTLQERLQGHRYLLSPKALELDQGANYEDWKFRLYGVTNAPFHLRAAGNFGEPLVPQASYEVMDRLYSAKSAEEASKLFAWTDIRYLLTPGPVPPSKDFSDEGAVLWRLNRFRGASAGAYFLTEGAGDALPERLPQDIPAMAANALEVERPRDDRYSISSASPESGWVYVGEPRFPGWRIRLSTERGEGTIQSLPALGAFQKVHVPAGAWRLDFRYEPGSWLKGLLLTVAALLAAAAGAWRRAREALS